jgi:hypothetical protein
MRTAIKLYECFPSDDVRGVFAMVRSCYPWQRMVCKPLIRISLLMGNLGCLNVQRRLEILGALLALSGRS